MASRTWVIAIVAAVVLVVIVIVSVLFVMSQHRELKSIHNTERKTEANALKGSDPTLGRHDNKIIHYYLGESFLPFDPKDRGLRGSKTAVVELSQELAKMGYQVVVYGRFDMPKAVKGVLYVDYRTFKRCPKDNSVLILWRRTGCAILSKIEKKNFAKIFVDLHDTDYFLNLFDTGQETKKSQFTEIDKFIYSREQAKKVDHFMVKSKYQKHRYFPSLDGREEKFSIVPNGVTDIDEYRALVSVPKNVNKFIHIGCDIYYLAGLLQWSWPLIRNALPNATLHVCYDISEPIHENMTDLLKSTPGVIDYGRLSRDKMRPLIADAMFRLYPSKSSYKIDCITIKESALAGIISILPGKKLFLEEPGVFFEEKPREKCAVPSFERAAKLAIDLAEKIEKTPSLYNQILDGMEPNIKTRCLSWEDVAKTWFSLLQK